MRLKHTYVLPLMPFTFGTVVLVAMLLLAACIAGIPVKTEKPSDHFDIDYIETHQGSTREEVVQKLGVPDRIFRSNEKTWYVYQASGDTRMILGAVFIVPPFFVPFWVPKDEGDALHCLALLFDEKGLLQDYKAGTAPEEAWGGLLLPPEPGAWPWGAEVTACDSVLWNKKELAKLDLMPQYTPPGLIEGGALTVGEVDGVPLVIAADSSQTLHFWDVQANRLLERSLSGHEAVVTSVVFGRLDGSPIVVSGSADQTIRIWDARTGRPLGEPMRGHEGPVVRVALIEVAGTPTVFSAGEDRTVRSWDARSGKLLDLYALEGQPLALGDAGGRPVVITSAFDQTLYLRDLLEGGVPVAPLPGREGLGTAVAVAVIDGRPVLASGGGDNAIHILDAKTGTPMREPLHGHQAPVTAVTLGEFDDIAAVVSADESNRILLWNLAGTGAPLTAPMVGAGAGIMAVILFELHGVPLIAASNTDHNVQLWDARSGLPFGRPMWYDPLMQKAEQGDTESQMAVYRHLRETDQNQALHWLCKAADNGHFKAQLELGKWYWRGPDGVARDKVKAHVWYSLAARQSAGTWDLWELRAVTNQMTSEQQAEAQRALDAFQPGQCEQDLDTDRQP